jgi:phage minor structural protein
MKPILFAAQETSFTTLGLGVLADAISCTVTEERNGQYELVMQYPVTGARYPDLQDRNIIYAIPSPHRGPQPFRIYRIDYPINGIITVYAQHISYDLSGIPVKPFTGAVSCSDALQKLISNSVIANPFTTWTDKNVLGDYSVDRPQSCRALLGGTQGSILDVFGKGEYEFNKFQIKLYVSRGQDRGFVIRYGKNLIDLNQERNIQNVVTGIYPYWKSEDGELVQLDSYIVNATGTFDYTKIKTVDFTDNWEEAPSQADLLAAAQTYITNNEVGVPQVSLDIAFTELGTLEECDLCDIVTVQFEQLGIEEQAEIIKIETDVLLERYNKIRVGTPKVSLADTINIQNKELEKVPNLTTIAQVVIDQTNLITGQTGGYFVVIYDNDPNSPTYEQPTGWAIMDTPETETCVNVWRFTAGGFGHSSTGWAGPYSDVSITMDGKIVAQELLVQSNDYLSSYFKVGLVNGNPVVKIGSSSSDYIMVLEADRLSFQDQYGNVQAYFEGDSFVLQELDTFRIGNLQIKTQGSPYSLSFVKAV